MSRRSPGYVISLLLMAAILSVPQLIVAFSVAWDGYLQNRWPLSAIPALAQPNYSNQAEPLPFWRDKFVHFIPSNKQAYGSEEHRIWLIDPETGQLDDLKPTLPGHDYFEKIVFGDRIFFVGNTGSFELVEGALRKSNFVTPGLELHPGQKFLWEGRPAFIDRSENEFTVWTFQDTGWTSIGVVANSEPPWLWTIARIQILIDKSSWIQVCTSQDEIHLFLHAHGHLLYRRGLEIDQHPIPTMVDEEAFFPTLNEIVDQKFSSTKKGYRDATRSGWTVIGWKPVSRIIESTGLLIKGQPAALMIEQPTPGIRVAHLFRPEGTIWTEFAAQRFPNDLWFNTATTSDGQHSYVGVSGWNVDPTTYAIEQQGFRKTNGVAAANHTRDWMIQLRDLAQSTLAVLAATLVLGTLLGTLTWLSMKRFTKADYQFGTQTVKLASLARRGIARLIDLALVGITTAGLGWLLTRGFDGQSWDEALTLHVRHPTIDAAQKIAAILVAWFATLVIAMLIAQAYWGATPGKWLCRMKTVRTSLRPCGFAASLVRELLFFVDCCYLLCWTPGILSIAFTDKRQRLGDLIADTIVVESRPQNEDR